MTTQEDLPSATTTAVSSSQSLCQASNTQPLQHEPVTEKDSVLPEQDIETQPIADGENAVPTVDSPPNGGYGWLFTDAQLRSYGVFLSYYLANDVFPGATSIDYALIGGLSIGAAMLVSPAATYTTGRYGTQTTLLIGVFLETLSLIAASFARTTWQLFLSQGACFGLGMGFLFVGSVGVIPQWFTTRRSLANGCAAGGSGLGGLAYSLATGAMIPRIGLPWTFRVLGIVTCVVNFICSVLIKDRNKIIGARQVPFDHKLFKRWEYVLMEAWAFFSMLGYVVLLFSLPSYVVSVGLNQQQAAVIGALLNLGQGLGRPVVGMFSDVGGRINVAAILTAICGLFCLVIWIFAKSYGVLIFFSLVVGTVAGTIWTTVGPVAAEVSEAIGLEIVSASKTTPTTPTTADNNPYLYAQIYTGLMYLVAAGCAWLLRAWKIGQMEVLLLAAAAAAAEKGEKGEDVNTVDDPVLCADIPISSTKKKKEKGLGKRSSLVRRLFVVKRV
ncbi:MAG: hypothetical protein GOMPHAMPRED_001982 [Gomphillus americanus]|uniref:Uncharacterized protein n=1 Tax=Gomphillus americanus TaxID=1940652 RepID=A0A8H3F8V5_9LECA|nr:MAG: hypothetical protein GOMPHAMPRED_001982 [Gomphillus americanus]